MDWLWSAVTAIFRPGVPVHPILFELAGRPFYSYGLLAVLAMFAAGYVVQRLFRRHGIDSGAAFELTVAAILGGLAGARLYWLAEHWREVHGSLLHGVMGGAGFTWYGGLLGGVVAVIALARYRRLPLGLVANLMAPAVTLGYAVARIGCLLAGDGTYGRPSGLPWAVAFPHGMVPTSVPVQPTPAYETLTMLVLFAVLYRMARRPQPGWHLFAWFLVLSGVERFAVEFLRTNPLWLLGLTPPQWFALASVLVGTGVLLAQRLRRGVTLEPAACPGRDCA
jgi:phosphatidylglycerol---prolipoprotein diacylglyceryl transferase